MARLKLIEYLNDPSLLHTISEAEMIAWAAEVPYAGLVQRLLAQKLAIESSEEHLKERANTMAIISNANPDYTIRSIEDFKQLVLKGGIKEGEKKDVGVTKDESQKEHSIGTTGHGISDEDAGLTDHSVIVEDDVSGSRGENLKKDAEHEEALGLKEDEPTVPVLKDNVDQAKEDESEFSIWLAGLQALETASEEDASPLELKEKALASEPLAELLVSQGHYSRAIAMYELLILKYPQKSSFFAAQIEKVKAL